MAEETANMSKDDLKKRFKEIAVQMRDNMMKETLAITIEAVIAAVLIPF